MEELKRRNEEAVLKNSELSDLLEVKNRKVSELKHKVKDYEVRIRGYEERVNHLQSIMTNNPKSPSNLDKPSDQILNSYQQQLKTFESSQKAMLEHMEKYRIVER